MKLEVVAWPVTVFWFRRGRPCSANGHAIDEAERFVISLEDDVDWFPAEALYVARGSGAHREVAVAHVAETRGPTLVAELLAPWRRYDRRQDRRHAARLKTTVAEQGSVVAQGGKILNLSLGGVRVALSTPPSGRFVEVTLAALDYSASLRCEVVSIKPAADGVEVRLRFLEVSAQSLVALHTVLCHFHTMEGRRAA